MIFDRGLMAAATLRGDVSSKAMRTTDKDMAWKCEEWVVGTLEWHAIRQRLPAAGWSPLGGMCATIGALAAAAAKSLGQARHLGEQRTAK